MTLMLILTLCPDLNNNAANQYFNFEAFSHLQTSHDDFSILSFNIRSLSSNYNEFHALFCRNNFFMPFIYRKTG